MQILNKLILAWNQLCMFLAVAQTDDDPSEPSCAVTEGSLNLSEMETLRQLPPNPLANKAGGHSRRKRGGDPTPRTGNTMNGDTIRNLIQKASKDARCEKVTVIEQFFTTRPQKKSLGLEVPHRVCKCWRSRGQSLGCHLGSRRMQ